MAETLHRSMQLVHSDTEKWCVLKLEGKCPQACFFCRKKLALLKKHKCKFHGSFPSSKQYRKNVQWYCQPVQMRSLREINYLRGAWGKLQIVWVCAIVSCKIQKATEEQTHCTCDALTCKTIWKVLWEDNIASAITWVSVQTQIAEQGQISSNWQYWVPYLSI